MAKKTTKKTPSVFAEPKETPKKEPKEKKASKKDDEDFAPKKASSRKITASSTAEYFSKNLQQVGFSSLTKAVLTTVKEAVDNSLDACEDAKILPEVFIKIKKLGNGSLKNSEKLKITVIDNGPGIDPDDIAKVFGEYLASSKFGRGRCSRGQQGIGISAATTWALQTTATPVRVISKTSKMKKAVSCSVEVDLKNNKGVVRDKNTIDWDRPHGTSVEFVIDGRIQMNGEAGLLNYIRGTVLVNPHLTLHYELPEMKETTIARVTEEVKPAPEATEPHPHTMKLGEFIAHARLFGRTRLGNWLKTGFSRLSDKVISEIFTANKISRSILDKSCESASDEDLKTIYAGIQSATLMAPSTQSVISIGEEALSLSIERLGDIDFFSVVTRKPSICDFKPVQVEVAMARIQGGDANSEEPVQVLRFANRVPLQFDKAACAIVKAINTVNWRSYGLKQPKDSLPLGPYTIAVSVVSPFIKFKNASKETIDASDELVEELRRTLIQAGQKLSRHLSRENKAAELEQKIQHLEQFGPILIETLCRITDADKKRKEKAIEGMKKILGRDTKETASQLEDAKTRLDEHLLKRKNRLTTFQDEDESFRQKEAEEAAALAAEEAEAAGAEETAADEAGDEGGKNSKKKKKKKSKDSEQEGSEA